MLLFILFLILLLLSQYLNFYLFFYVIINCLGFAIFECNYLQLN